MSNHEKLFNYLVGPRGGQEADNEKTYLLGERSKNKVVMISGKWGSGKTYFWKDIKKNKLANIPDVYISLYGKDSIEQIEKDLMFKAYKLSVGASNDESDFIEKTFSTFSRASKGIDSIFGTKIDSLFQVVEDANNNSKLKNSAKTINDGLIICFDDFERKSSKIDLNDLFGFITNLSLDFSCRIVIILNSDVFKGDEAYVFKTVKEKTVDKFFQYNPSQEYLYNEIKEAISAGNINADTHRKILSIIKITDELNARIYEQTILNVNEYIDKMGDISDYLLNVLVLNTIYFNIMHSTIMFLNNGRYERDDLRIDYGGSIGNSLNLMYIDFYRNNIPDDLERWIYDTDLSSFNTFEKKIKKDIASREKNGLYLAAFETHGQQMYIIAKYVLIYKIFDTSGGRRSEIEKINNFIETGII